MDILAFPSHGSMGEVAQEGMTLRDYFAAKYMQGFIAAPDREDQYSHVTKDDCARLAYEMADAMLQERTSPAPTRKNYTRQIESATARGDRMAATLRRLVDALRSTEALTAGAPLIDAIAMLDDDEMIPF